jgi:hypothetical protein
MLYDMRPTLTGCQEGCSNPRTCHQQNAGLKLPSEPLSVHLSSVLPLELALLEPGNWSTVLLGRAR